MDAPDSFFDQQAFQITFNTSPRSLSLRAQRERLERILDYHGQVQHIRTELWTKVQQARHAIKEAEEAAERERIESRPSEEAPLDKCAVCLTNVRQSRDLSDRRVADRRLRNIRIRTSPRELIEVRALLCFDHLDFDGILTRPGEIEHED